VSPAVAAASLNHELAAWALGAGLVVIGLYVLVAIVLLWLNRDKGPGM